MAIKRYSKLSQDTPVASACICGNRLQIGSECWICYENRTGRDAAHDKILYEHLESIGLGKRENETKQQHSARCREWLLAHGGLGRAIAARARIPA